MRVCVLSECALSGKHGTGGQMIRLFDWSDPGLFHLYLTSFYAGLSETGRSFRLEDPRYLGRGRRFVKPIERALGLNWWAGDEIRPHRLRGLLARERLGADVAYAIPAHEEHARKMSSLLGALGVPYVVHLMDIYHPAGLDPATMPGFRKLLAGAGATVAISDAIADEMAKFGGPRPRIVPITQAATAAVAQAPRPGEPLRMLLVGKPYAESVALLVKSWERLRAELPELEVHYAGQHKLEFPAHVRAQLASSDYISSPAQYAATLARCHVAFFSGPIALDHFGKFSIASRLADFLMAGLPILACMGEGTAMQRFLDPLMPDAVRYTRTPDELVAALAAVRAPDAWRRAHERARAFASERLDVVKTRAAVQAAVRAASGALTLEGDGL